MSLKNNRLWIFGRKAPSLFAALLTMVLVGGSLFYAAAQRNSVESASSTISNRAFPEPNNALAPASTVLFQQLYCASDDGRRNYCNADTRNGVRLIRQRSGSACTQGRTWGYDRRGIWVDRGCRADFELGDRGYGRDRDRDRDRDNDRGRDRGGYVQTVYCESGDGRRHWCSEGIGASVRLIRQRSDSACVRGRTWGQDRSGIWVDRGCRADFEVRR
jgi:hypothetical protein